MITASELAGFFAAHAVWTVADGGPLTPMLAFTKADGRREMKRFVGGELSALVAQARTELLANAMGAEDSVLVFDGRIAPAGAGGDADKVDAIILELRAKGVPGAEAVIAVPYTPKRSGAFRVHKPKLVLWRGCDAIDRSAALQAFFSGVEAHEKGAPIWKAASDTSK